MENEKEWFFGERCCHRDFGNGTFEGYLRFDESEVDVRFDDFGIRLVPVSELSLPQEENYDRIYKILKDQNNS